MTVTKKTEEWRSQLTLAIHAARATRSNLESMEKLLQACGDAIDADRIVLGEIIIDHARVIVSYGDDTLLEGQLHKLPDHITAALSLTDRVISPTPGIGFDYYISIGKKYVLMVDDTNDARQFSREEDRILTLLQYLFLEILMGIDDRETSERDGLTEVYNRAFLDSKLQQLEEDRRSAENVKPISILMVDCDHFKQKNDDFGHAVGDRILIELGKVLRKSVRKADFVSARTIKINKSISDYNMSSEGFVARYGGEEFTIVLLGDEKAATVVAERIRLKIEQDVTNTIKDVLQSKLQTLDGDARKTMLAKIENLQITASFGVATQHNGEPLSEIRQRADEALYVAKETGRNKIEIFDTAA